MNGKFIVFEGIDGCGKTTQLHMLAEWLDSKNIKTFVTAEPSGGEIGRRIRRCLSGEESADGRTIGELFAADRVEHVASLNARLESGEWVLCDRYFLSSLAYQGECMTAEELTDINRKSLEGLLPTLTLYFDITPEAAEVRLDRRGGEHEIFEKLSYQKRVYERYDAAITSRKSSDNIVRIDATPDESAVFDEVRRVVADVFGL